MLQKPVINIEEASSSLDQPPASTASLEAGPRFKKIKAKTGEGTRAYRSLRSNTCENLSAIPQVNQAHTPPSLLLISLVFGVYVMAFGGKMRKLSVNLNFKSGKSHATPLTKHNN